jgi:hypothetical protein
MPLHRYPADLSAGRLRTHHFTSVFLSRACDDEGLSWNTSRTESTNGADDNARLAYCVHLTERGLSAATMARRLAALRSVVTLAWTHGRVAWLLDLKGPRSESYRDTPGAGLDGWRPRETALAWIPSK